MTDNKKNIAKVLLWSAVPFAACAVFLFLFLQRSQEFVYFYREQQQIFLYDNDYLLDLLRPIGGFAVLVGQWLVQFFVVPKMGAFLSTLLSLLTALFLLLPLRKLNRHSLWLVPLAFLPTFLYNLCLQDSYVHYDGLVALLMAAACLWLYSLLPKDRWALRLGGGIVLTLGIFYLAGSVAVLLGLSLLIFDPLRRAEKAYLSIVPLALTLIVGFIAVNRGWIVDYDYAFWTKGYCEYYFEPTSLHTLAWLALPLLFLLAAAAEKWQLPKPWAQAALTVVMTVLLCLGYVQLSGNHQNKAYSVLLAQIHYADTEEWDKLLAVEGVSASSDVQMNYLNLALSKQGRLLNDLFYYPQQSINSLMTGYEQYTDMGVLMSRLYYQMGVIGAAQYMAFSTTVGITYGNPSMTKLLIKTYLINGNYRMAEKQIRRLEKSWHYADWAREQRKFLNDDAAVEADPELGKLRKSLPDNDGFAMLYGPINDQKEVLDANPDNREAAEYAVAMLLITKDMQTLKEFVERYEGKGYFAQPPLRLQEAIVAMSEHDPDYCRAHGVSEEVINRFTTFRQQVLNLRRSGATNMSSLAAEYGRTFWYYMIK